MKIDEVIWTDKMRAVMRDDAQILYLVGATGCSKTLLAGFKFMDLLNTSGADKNQFYIICRDMGTGVRNIIHNKASFYNLFDFMHTPFSNNLAGGGQFTWHGVYGDKIVYLCGADNVSSWTKLVGGNPDGIWLEELSVLHIDYIRECMGRAISRRCPLIATTNGGLPTQPFYTEFVNKAVVQFKNTVPQIELREMTEESKYAHYYHFNLEDDAPHLSKEDKENLKALYPENSFYYFSKVMGVRGFAEGGAYALLMDKEKHLIPFDSIDLKAFEEIDLFVDIGSNKNPSDTSKASTIASLVGYTKGCQRIVVLECWVVPATSHDDIIKYVEDKIEWWWVKHMFRLKKIVIDSAESILINTWRMKNRYNTILVKGSVKNYKQIITLITRCELKQQLLLQGRLLWSSRAINNYEAHTRILLNEDGSEMDLAVQDNDMGDTIAYALTENWNRITTQVKRS